MRNFDDVPTLAQDSPSHSPRRRPKGWVRRCERSCMTCLSLFPLVFVYGLTSWACWVQATLGFLDSKGYWTGPASAVVGIVLFGLLNWCYTTAVFTDPGSPLSTTNAYSALPSHDDPSGPSLTVKSTGEMRFCKKCQTRKPDRAHHCSTCRRCVLKMDHHCPWLATCVGLRNYKPFLLFLIYTCLFCFLCFAVSGTWVWSEIIGDTPFGEEARLMPVNFILLSVLAGILGLVLSGFTGWHVYLTVTGQTTIESLERNRYISPLRRNIQAQLRPHQHRVGVDSPTHERNEQTLGDHLREIHANAIPGVTRPEEGEEDSSRASPALSAMRMSYADMEAARERARYSSYLDELDSAKLPNAFDHGWRVNARQVFGNAPLLWALPVCNSIGDGWRWEPSPRWTAARDELARARELAGAGRQAGWDGRATGMPPNGPRAMPSYPIRDQARQGPPRGPSPHGDDEDDDDDDGGDQSKTRLLPDRNAATAQGQWNDLPDDMLDVPSRNQSRAGVRPRSPRPARAYPDR